MCPLEDALTLSLRGLSRVPNQRAELRQAEPKATDVHLVPRNKACWSVTVMGAVITKMAVAGEVAQSQIEQVQRHDPPGYLCGLW